MKKIAKISGLLVGLLSLSPMLMAQNTAPASIDTGDTAWMIVATVLVLMMTIPGLALFYGGLVRRKNVLSILMQCLVLTGVITIVWFAIGYSLAFGIGAKGTFLGNFIGGFDKFFLNGITPETIWTGYKIPEILFALFQCMFAVITPALIIGAFAERVKFSGFLLYSILWSILVYSPMAFFVWNGEGWLFKLGALDFAGGTVVHINAGVSALIFCLLVGRRKGYKSTGHPIIPHNIPLVVIGTSLLWLGWIGFNAGSGLASNGIAANAFLVTHLATAVAATTWMCMDWIINKKPTVVGFCTGAVAGLVAITPAAGSADVLGAFGIGIASSIICFIMVAYVKTKLTYDDSLDAFGVHGIGGIIGSILTGVFASPIVTGGAKGALYGDWHQLLVQLIATGFAIVFSAVMCFILFKIVDATVGIRTTKEEESIGLDISQHGELAYSEDE